jgi:methylmalonyl-CoA mutase N-terminal domain/subunit
MGGTIEAVERGYIQQEIQNAAYSFQKDVDNEEQIVVGVNRFQIGKEDLPEIQRIDPALERAQIERLRALRSKRDPQRWKSALEHTEDAARTGANLMPFIIEAVESYCTIGEISNALRGVFGEYQEVMVV